MQIHPSAIISKKAKIGSDAVIGPYVVIGENVKVGSKTKVGPFCVVEGYTSIGNSCEIFTGAVLGSKPQDLKYKGVQSFLEIGDNNIIREYCTFNPGVKENSKTIIGNNNLFMAYSHVAHDCLVGNNCIVANNGTFAGHVVIEDNVVMGGLSAVHQFVRVGKLSIIGGCSKVVQDVPPYSTCDGHPARIYGLNLIGLKRAGVDRGSIIKLRQAYKILFNSGFSIKHALENLGHEVKSDKEVIYLIDFIKHAQRGIAHSCRYRNNTQDKTL